ncbi:hypothetical protein [Ekhidna sp.]|uniref:hypothetical protein n=1 Tax=Ekhidna sp. TaxID=2608089 RepID=UPI003C7B9DD2
MMYWIIHIILLSLLAFVVFRFVKTGLPNWMFWIALCMKLAAGVILGLIFFEYYGSGDTINFFEYAKNSHLYNGDNQPRTQFFVLLLKPFVTLSGGSYWITSIYFSFISFTCFWYGSKILIAFYPHLKWVITVSLLFIPSIIFWSSGIIKDSLASAALIILVTSTIKVYHGRKINLLDAVLIVVSAFLLYKIKHYLLITFIVFGGVLFALMLFKSLSRKWKFTSFLIIIVAFFTTQFIHPYLEIDRIPWTLYQNNSAIIEKSDAEDELDIEIQSDSWSEIWSNVPKALHAGLFRPSIYDHTPFWGWLHRAENLVLTILILMSFLLWLKEKPTVDWPLFIASVCGILLLAILLPLSTPNFGTLVRYKNAYMPYLFLISSILPYQYLASQREE